MQTEHEIDRHILNLLEVKINEWAKTKCDEFRLQPESFRIIIKTPQTPKPTRYGYVVQDGSYNDWMANEKNSPVRAKKTHIVQPQDLLHSHSQVLAEVSNGAVVVITLYVPLMKQDESLNKNLQKTINHMKKTVLRLFKYISTPRLHQDSDLFNPLILGDTIHEYTEDTGYKTRKWSRRKYNPHVLNDTKKEDFIVESKRTVTFTHKETGITFSVVDNTNQRPYWDMERECWEKCSSIVQGKIEREENMSKALVPYYLMDDVRLISRYVQSQTIIWEH